MSNKLFMAFSAGKESTEGGEVKRYIGVAPVYVLDVNPNKENLEKYYNTTIENEPEYVKELERNGKKVPTVRIDFIVRSDADKCGLDFTSKVSIFVRKEANYNNDGTKVQVIDKYGRTCWATVEQAKNHEIPQYSNGPANIDKDYRPAYVGEEALTNFIKAYLNIPNVMRYINGTWKMVDNPKDCEARLDKIANYFTGDFKELKSVIALQPKNKVKILLGVKSTDDGKQYQDVYTNTFLKNNVTDYSRLDKDVKESQSSGAYPSTEFEVVAVKEYNPTATNFDVVDSSASDDMPFGDNPFDL